MTWNRHAITCALALAILLTVLALAAVPVSALKVEGARIALDIEPGKTYTSPIAVSIKPEESEGDFAIDVMGFSQSPADGTYTGLEAAKDTGQYSARPFISIDKPTVHLKSGERAEITATINVPADARDGGRYAIILVHPTAAAGGQPAAFTTAVAIPVLLTVKGGTVTETGEIATVEPVTAEPGTPFQVATTFRNTGNHHYYGAVNNVTITDAQGKVVAVSGTNPFDKALVPGQPVKISVAFGTGLAQGTYQVTSRMYKQDGGLLAEKKVSLQVGSPGLTRETQADAQATPARTSPGFEVALVGIALAIFGAVRPGKGGK